MWAPHCSSYAALPRFVNCPRSCCMSRCSHLTFAGQAQMPGCTSHFLTARASHHASSTWIRVPTILSEAWCVLVFRNMRANICGEDLPGEICMQDVCWGHAYSNMHARCAWSLYDCSADSLGWLNKYLFLALPSFSFSTAASVTCALH